MKNIILYEHKINKENKEKLLKQKACVLWFTGLSGSGKSTLAVEVEKRLYENKKLTVLLDGDNIRHDLNSDLEFSDQDRKENLRRIREVAKLFYNNGIITLVSFISPFKESRKLARNLIGHDFIEIFVNCPLEICEQRDPKEFYKKAKAGEIKNYTGIDSIYEKPENPEIVINTHEKSIENCVKIVLYYLKTKKYLIGI